MIAIPDLSVVHARKALVWLASTAALVLAGAVTPSHAQQGAWRPDRPSRKVTMRLSRMTRLLILTALLLGWGALSRRGGPHLKGRETPADTSLGH